MPLNEKKVVSIILSEANKIDEKCSGYKKEISAVLADIVMYERQHRVQGTNIQKKINEKCNATGKFLAETRGA